MTEQTLRMKILRQVALQADTFYSDAQRLGIAAAIALTGNKRSQITNLESIADSALKVTDIYDFIKTRTARDARQSDAEKKRGWHQEDLGEDLLKFVEVELKKRKNDLCQRLEIDPHTLTGQQVHLLLIREFVRQLAAHYEYTCYQRSGGKK